MNPTRNSKQFFKTALAAGMLGTAALAHADDLGTCGLFPFDPLVSNGLDGDASNTIYPAPPADDFNGGCEEPTGVRTVYIGGSIERRHPASTPGQMRVEVTAPDGQKVVVQPFDSDAQFDDFGGSYTEATHGATFPAPVNTTGTWTFRLFETVDDGGAAEEDAVWYSINVIFSDHDGTAPTSTIDLGSLTPGAAGMPNTAISTDDYMGPDEALWYKVNLPTAIDPANDFYFDVDTRGSYAIYEDDASDEIRLALYNAAGNLLEQIQPYGGVPSHFAFGTGNRVRNGSIFSSGDRLLPAGDYYIAVTNRYGIFREDFGLGVDSFNFPADGFIDMTLTAGTHVQATAPTATDLGTLDECGLRLADVPMATDGTTVNWYTFTLAGDVDAGLGTFLDIDNNGSDLIEDNPFIPGQNFASTLLTLFDSNGDLVAAQDRGGFENLAQMSFGQGGRNGIGYQTTPILGPEGVPTLPYPYTLTDDYGGFNGSLTAGTYYLAITSNHLPDSSQLYGTSDWIVVPTDGYSGTFDLNIRTNVGAASGGCCEPWIVPLSTDTLTYYREAIYYRSFPFFPPFPQPGLRGTVSGDTPVLFFSELTSDTGGGTTYQWYKDGQPLTDDPGRISGATTSTLLITPPLVSDSGTYHLQATSPCGSATGASHEVVVVAEPCRADFNRDGAGNFFDLLDFLDDWFAMDYFWADFNRDYSVDFFDLLSFLDTWFAGCP